MEFLLQILLGMVTLICLLGGANLLIKGSRGFLEKSIPNQVVLDNLFRFLSGIYFGLGFLMAWVVLHLKSFNELIYFIGIVVMFSGLGRLYSLIKVGSAGNYFNIMMIVEILLGVAIVVLQFFR